MVAGFKSEKAAAFSWNLQKGEAILGDRTEPPFIDHEVTQYRCFMRCHRALRGGRAAHRRQSRAPTMAVLF
jgi:hypothetical protein